jgi:hypothetical protein
MISAASRVAPDDLAAMEMDYPDWGRLDACRPGRPRPACRWSTSATASAAISSASCPTTTDRRHAFVSSAADFGAGRTTRWSFWLFTPVEPDG